MSILKLQNVHSGDMT